MKLYYTSTSPFVRKVLVTAHELGLAERITLETLRPQPTAPSAELSQHNPLSKIPALVLDDGECLFDSRVICEYLETVRGPGPALVPQAGLERFRVLRTQALADGMLDAGILVFYERAQRPPEKHWDDWLSGQSTKVRQGLDALNQAAPAFGATPDIGQIAAGAAVGWLAFRSVVGDPFEGRPALAEWFHRFDARPSMAATRPHA